MFNAYDSPSGVNYVATISVYKQIYLSVFSSMLQPKWGEMCSNSQLARANVSQHVEQQVVAQAVRLCSQHVRANVSQHVQQQMVAQVG